MGLPNTASVKLYGKNRKTGGALPILTSSRVWVGGLDWGQTIKWWKATYLNPLSGGSKCNVHSELWVSDTIGNNPVGHWPAQRPCKFMGTLTGELGGSRSCSGMFSFWAEYDCGWIRVRTSQTLTFQKLLSWSLAFVREKKTPLLQMALHLILETYNWKASHSQLCFYASCSVLHGQLILFLKKKIIFYWNLFIKPSTGYILSRCLFSKKSQSISYFPLIDLWCLLLWYACKVIVYYCH